MKNRHRLMLVGVVLAAGLAGVRLAAQTKDSFPSAPLVPSGTVVFHDATSPEGLVPMNYPDKFAWKLFLEVNRKGPRDNDAVWETWADDPQTFPAEPDPSNKPVWSGDAAGGKPAKSLRSTQRTRALTKPAVAQAAKVDVPKLPAGGFGVPNGAGVGEEVHRNKVTFDYIVNNGLWYQEGIAEFFARASKAAGNDVAFAAKAVNFPRGSIEVKANWIVIEEKDKPRYHWNHNAAGQLLGLVAMHVSSKDLPNWFWCTFEHVDNPGRGDFIGIHDGFGAVPSHTPSHTDKAGGVYPAEGLTKKVLAMFAENGYTGDWLEQYKNYRLKGSQIDFTDSAGRPLVLGNSVTEAGFVPSASCITCHARAAVNAAGASSFPIFGEQATLPLLGTDPLQPVLTYNGRPDPTWYFREVGGGTTLVNLQTDFVWAIPFNAQPAKKVK